MESCNCRTFGDKLYELRNRKGLSQETFAGIIGVSRQVVSTWEANKAQPNASKFSAISNALGVKIEFLFDESRTLAEITAKDCINSNDSVCIDILHENAIQEELTQQKQVGQECANGTANCGQCCEYINYMKQKSHARKKTIIKIVIGVVISAILLGLTFIVFGILSKPTMKEGDFDTGERSVVWNFSAENIGWIIFSVAIGICVIVGIVMLCKYIRRKVSNKRANGENK